MDSNSRSIPWETMDGARIRSVTPPTPRTRTRTDEGRFTPMPGGLGRWEATPQPPPAKPTVLAPSPHATQKAPSPSAPTQRLQQPEATRIFKYLADAEVPTAHRAVAEQAIRYTLSLHGLPPDAVQLRWVRRLAPGASVMGDDEFRDHHDMGGKTRSDGFDGRTVTISLRYDLPLETIAETALHEAFHSVQYLRRPEAMRQAAVSEQVEEQARAFAARHLRNLKGLIESFGKPTRG